MGVYIIDLNSFPYIFFYNERNEAIISKDYENARINSVCTVIDSVVNVNVFMK